MTDRWKEIIPIAFKKCGGNKYALNCGWDELFGLCDCLWLLVSPSTVFWCLIKSINIHIPQGSLDGYILISNNGL